MVITNSISHNKDVIDGATSLLDLPTNVELEGEPSCSGLIVSSNCRHSSPKIPLEKRDLKKRMTDLATRRPDAILGRMKTHEIFDDEETEVPPKWQPSTNVRRSAQQNVPTEIIIIDSD